MLSRQSLVELLHTVTVATMTPTGRGRRCSPTEVELGVDEGLRKTSFVNLVNVFTVPKASLGRFVGTASQQKMQAVCQALATAVGCD